MTFGEVMNIVNNDASNLEDFCDVVGSVFTLPLEITVGKLLTKLRSSRPVLPDGLGCLRGTGDSRSHDVDQLVCFEDVCIDKTEI